MIDVKMIILGSVVGSIISYLLILFINKRAKKDIINMYEEIIRDIKNSSITRR